jgi:hypothetical protein
VRWPGSLLPRSVAVVSVEERLRSVEALTASLQSQQARVEVQVAQAQAAVDRSLLALREEFGVETAEDGARVRAQLESELEEALREVEDALGGTAE